MKIIKNHKMNIYLKQEKLPKKIFIRYLNYFYKDIKKENEREKMFHHHLKRIKK